MLRNPWERARTCAGSAACQAPCTGGGRASASRLDTALRGHKRLNTYTTRRSALPLEKATYVSVPGSYTHMQGARMTRRCLRTTTSGQSLTSTKPGQIRKALGSNMRTQSTF